MRDQEDLLSEILDLAGDRAHRLQGFEEGVELLSYPKATGFELGLEGADQTCQKSPSTILIVRTGVRLFT